MVLTSLNLTQDNMSELNKKKRKKLKPATRAKESTRTVTKVPTKPRRKLITKKQAAAQSAKLKKYAKNLKPVPKPKMKGGAVGGGMIGGGKILKGGKMILKYVSKHLAKKGGAKALDKKTQK
jgi:hypothetical protein